jgi:hypothetical protein
MLERAEARGERMLRVLDCMEPFKYIEKAERNAEDDRRGEAGEIGVTRVKLEKL